MDRYNLINMRRILGGDPAGKLRLLCDPRDVDDPWYTGDFETAWLDINEGCGRLLNELFPESSR